MKKIFENDVFESGKEGYASYRIPSVIKAPNGDILVFCEGRKNSVSDYGYIDIILKRSSDNGMHWSSGQVIVSDGENTFGNPCCVTDYESGRIHMVCNFNLYDKGEREIQEGSAPRDAYYLFSDDNGISWSEPKDITKQVKHKNWGWLAFGPCHGIKTKEGRIIFPANYSIVNGFDGFHSYAIYSDDNCASFKRSEQVTVNTNECTLAQIGDGSIYMNMRSYEGDFRRRRAYSSDCGQTWHSYEKDDELIDPVCQGSAVYNTQKDLLAFSNAASKERENLTLRLSVDGGRSWQEGFTVNSGASAYSDIIWIDDNTIGCLYEAGECQPYEEIRFASVDISK